MAVALLSDCLMNKIVSELPNTDCSITVHTVHTDEIETGSGCSQLH